MRKEQEKILKKADKMHMGEPEIAVLRREDLTITELKRIYDYFRSQLKSGMDNAVIASEAERCLVLLEPIRKEKGMKYVYKRLADSLLPYGLKDTLIGSTKKRDLIKTFFFLLNLSEKYNIRDESWRFFSTYKKMLYEGFSTWQINTMLRKMFRCDSEKEMHYLSGYLFLVVPEFKDDFFHNDRRSLFFYVLKTLALDKITAYKGLFHSLYDWKNHCFVIQQEDYGKLFVNGTNSEGNARIEINEPFIDRLLMDRYPVIAMVSNFARNELVLDKENSDSVAWKKFGLEDNSLEEKCRRGYEALQTFFTVETKAYYLGIKISSNLFIKVSFYQYDSIRGGVQDGNGWCVDSCFSRRHYLISPDGRIFKELSQKKYYPLGMKEFYDLYQRDDVCGEFVRLLWNYYTSRNVFYNDIMKDVSECGTIIPLSVNEIMEYHNRAELIKKKYKTAAGIRIKWNKLNINLSYLITKAYRCVDPGKSRQILLQQRDVSLLLGNNYSMKAAYKPYKFLATVLYENIMKKERERVNVAIAAAKERYKKEIEDTVQTAVLPDEREQWMKEKIDEEISQYDIKSIVDDYVNMCRQAKIKVRLDIYKIEQMKNVHDYTTRSRINYRKITKKVELPENSRFLHLREILPEEFEWITTRKRLILETELQHHCVWSYADNITQDECAIYSFTDTAAEHCMDGKPRRYTVEFRQKRNGRYYVEQVQGKYDAVNAGGMKEYIQMLLTEYQDRAACG